MPAHSTTPRMHGDSRMARPRNGRVRTGRYAAAFQLSPVPNGKIVAVDFRQFMLVGEVEKRHQIDGHPGKVKFLAFVNRARMARYADAVELARRTGDVPDIALVR